MSTFDQVYQAALAGDRVKLLELTGPDGIDKHKRVVRRCGLVTPAALLASEGHFDAVLLLLHIGADYNFIARGYAVGGYHEKVEEYRTKYNANVDEIMRGYAWAKNDKKVEEYRDKHKANVDFATKEDLTPATPGSENPAKRRRGNDYKINQGSIATPNVNTIETQMLSQQVAILTQTLTNLSNSMSQQMAVMQARLDKQEKYIETLLALADNAPPATQTNQSQTLPNQDSSALADELESFQTSSSFFSFNR